MKLRYSHLLAASFYEWLNWKMVEEDGFIMRECRFIHHGDPKLPSSIKPYSCPFKQIVYNKIPDFTLPTSLSSDNSPINLTSLDVLDFNEGRVLAQSAPAKATSFMEEELPIREFNLYIVEEKGERFAFEANYSNNFRYNHMSPSPIDPYIYALPAIFISVLDAKNEPFALGGERLRGTQIRLIIIAENEFSLQACRDLLVDQAEKVIKLIGPNDTPLNGFGTLKPAFAGGYDYTSVAPFENKIVFIDSVVASVVKNDVTSKVDMKMFSGVVDIHLSTVLSP